MHKNTKAYPLWHHGSFTWNKKTRQLVFMRAGKPEAEREELRLPTYFYVEGDDIKHLYQVLHEHFQGPARLTRNWADDAEKPPPKHGVHDGWHNISIVEPHKNWEKVKKR